MPDGRLPGTLPPAVERSFAVTADADTVPGATLYRPSNLSNMRMPLPVIVTGLLGNCSPEGAPAMASAAAQGFHIPVASKGFLVLAVGKINPDAKGLVLSREVRPWRDALEALLVKAGDSSGSYHGKIDTKRIGTWGISCGGVLAFELAASDRRVGSVFGWSTSTSQRGTPESSRAMLAKLAPRPIAWTIGGPTDIPVPHTLRDWAEVPGTMPAFLAQHAFYDHAEMGAHVDPAAIVNWFDFILNGQSSAGDYFFGEPYGPCRSKPTCAWTTQRKNWPNRR